MGAFKQQERRQRRKKAREDELVAKNAARDAAEEARQAAAAELQERARRTEAALVAAKENRKAAAKKKRTAGVAVATTTSFNGSTAKKRVAGQKRSAEEAPGSDSNRADKKKKTGTVPSSAIAVNDVSKPRHKQKVLLLASRGISFRHRHLMNDLEALLPHSKKDSKLDTKSDLKVINELAELSNCNSCMFFEARRPEDLYLWLAKTPNGPSIKFHVQNVHTKDEMKMTGNCLKGSRHILSFDKNFDGQPHLQLMKQIFMQMFAVPRTSRRVKPFIDHIISFTLADGRVWIRNYQIVENAPPATTASDTTEQAEKEKKKKNTGKDEDIALVEIGPRFVLNPIRIFAGSFGGRTVYVNPLFVSPARVRAMTRHLRATRYKSRQLAETERKEKIQASQLEDDPLDGVFQ